MECYFRVLLFGLILDLGLGWSPRCAGRGFGRPFGVHWASFGRLWEAIWGPLAVILLTMGGQGCHFGDIG